MTSSATLQYLSKATAWDEQGRPENLLISNDYSLMALESWVLSMERWKGGEPDSLIRDYANACGDAKDASQPGWRDRLYAERSHCELCGERYRIENLAICTDCLRNYCHRCFIHFKGTAPNGNTLHSCGGELVG